MIFSRNIIILILSAIFIVEPNSFALSVFAAADREVHSIEELQIQADIQGRGIVGAPTLSGKIQIQNSIETLIASHIAYETVELLTQSPLDSTPLDSNAMSTFGQLHNDDISGEKSKKIKIVKSVKKEKKIPGSRGLVGATLKPGTIISSAGGENIDPKAIGIFSVDSRTNIKALEYISKKIPKSKKITDESVSSPDTFEFGIPGTHLIFSSPVALSIVTPGYSDGIIVDIATLHDGDMTFNTNGLSVNPLTECTLDGKATRPGNQGIVRGGKVTFYTCGASSFTINPVGGLAGSNDLKLIVGDYGQIQVYYDGKAQIYGGAPPVTGGGTPSVWPRLRVGTRNIGNGKTKWTSAVTTSSQVGNTYTAKNTLTYTRSGRTYTLIIDWEYTAPNKFFTWTYTLTIPSNNGNNNVKFYYGMDSYVAGSDGNGVGYYTNTPSQTVGVYDSVAKVLSAQRYVSGQTWAGYLVDRYSTVKSQTDGGSNYTNQIVANSDLGYGINWDFGKTPGTYTSTTEWRILPYVSTNVPDLIPGIGQPDVPLAVGVTSQLPLTLTNAGQASSSGTHTVVLTIPTGIIGPTVSTTSAGWSCGAQIGATVTCTKTTTIAPLDFESLNIPVKPATGTQGTVRTFTMTNSGGGDSNATNNSASVVLQVAIATMPSDTTLPNITSISIPSGKLLPTGNFPIMISYSDTGTDINVSSFSRKIYSWNIGTNTWNATDIAPTYTSLIGSPTTSGATFQVTGLPTGKYRFDISIADNIGNIRTQSPIYLVDAIEWSISSPQYDIGSIASNIQTFGSGEYIIIVKTVGAGFRIQMTSMSPLSSGADSISYWNGITGWGFDQWSGTTYANLLTSPSGSITIANQAANISSNGTKNTYTYRLKYGTKVSTEQMVGVYLSNLKFDISVDY